MHTASESISEEVFKILDNANKRGGMYWACWSCSAFAGKFYSGLQDINRRLSKLEEKVDTCVPEVEKVKSDSNDFRKDMEKLKEKVQQGAGQNSEAVFLEMRERE